MRFLCLHWKFNPLKLLHLYILYEENFKRNPYEYLGIMMSESSCCNQMLFLDWYVFLDLSVFVIQTSPPIRNPYMNPFNFNHSDLHYIKKKHFSDLSVMTMSGVQTISFLIGHTLIPQKSSGFHLVKSLYQPWKVMII